MNSWTLLREPETMVNALIGKVVGNSLFGNILDFSCPDPFRFEFEFSEISRKQYRTTRHRQAQHPIEHPAMIALYIEDVDHAFTIGKRRRIHYHQVELFG